ncbi:MAG: AraC family transcriptional regulator [Lentisphaeria bacterium]
MAPSHPSPTPPADAAQTLSCPQPPGLGRLRGHCTMAGHWRVRHHHLAHRATSDAILIYCVAGRGHFTLAGGPARTILPGDLFLCPPRLGHGYGCDPASGWEIWWAHFQGAHAEALCRAANLDASHPVAHPGLLPTLVQRFAALHRALETRTPQTAWDAAGCLHLLLLELVRLAAGGGTAAVPGHSLADLVADDGANLDELARRAGYSKFHFCRLFKRETGLPPWQYLTARKLDRAKELLLGTRRSIKEIAHELGFAHPDYFARLFARHAGATPARFRGSLAAPHGGEARPSS